MSAADIPVKCTRCRHACMESDWLKKPWKGHADCFEHVCPRCGCKSYYDCSPQVAWCWATGLIEIGDTLPADGPDGGGPIEIARGPKYALKGRLGAVARHGKGGSAGKLLVPGVPEAKPGAEIDALLDWLDWCGERKSRDGVTFSGRAA